MTVITGQLRRIADALEADNTARNEAKSAREAWGRVAKERQQDIRRIETMNQHRGQLMEALSKCGVQVSLQATSIYIGEETLEIAPIDDRRGPCSLELTLTCELRDEVARLAKEHRISDAEYIRRLLVKRRL